jgi:hypothetical protein
LGNSTIFRKGKSLVALRSTNWKNLQCTTFQRIAVFLARKTIKRKVDISVECIISSQNDQKLARLFQHADRPSAEKVYIMQDAGMLGCKITTHLTSASTPATSPDKLEHQLQRICTAVMLTTGGTQLLYTMALITYVTISTTEAVCLSGYNYIAVRETVRLRTVLMAV